MVLLPVWPSSRMRLAGGVLRLRARQRRRRRDDVWAAHRGPVAAQERAALLSVGDGAQRFAVGFAGAAQGAHPGAERDQVLRGVSRRGDGLLFDEIAAAVEDVAVRAILIAFG